MGRLESVKIGARPRPLSKSRRRPVHRQRGVCLSDRQLRRYEHRLVSAPERLQLARPIDDRDRQREVPLEAHRDRPIDDLSCVTPADVFYDSSLSRPSADSHYAAAGATP
jgi:hypothetical protein